MSSDEMRNMFFIVKGSYAKTEPHFINSVTGDTQYIGGYDPYNSDTKEWYMLFDNRNFKCIACGSEFEKVLKGVYNNIKYYKGNYKKYLKHTTDCVRPSPVMQCLYTRIYEEYGDYFSEEVQEMEDLAYSELKEETPLNKTRKLLAKGKARLQKVDTTPKEVEEIETPTPKKTIKPKVKMGVKKLSF